MPTKIEWAEETWNPITGCTPISEGCKNCYAKRMATRLRGRCGYPAADPLRVTFHSERLEQPLKWKKQRMIFVCSMGDLFHKQVKTEWINNVFDVINGCPQHRFIFLTKLPGRMRAYFELSSIAGTLPTGELLFENIWLGVTAENQQRADERIPTLLQIPVAVRFVSIEPMLGPVDLTKAMPPEADLAWTIRQCGLDWVICGGESGPGARPMHPDWARALRDQCQAAGVPFFFKQWGEWAGGKFDSRKGKMVCYPCASGETTGRIFWTNPGAPRVHLWGEADHYWTNASARVGKKAAGRLLDDEEWNQYPDQR